MKSETISLKTAIKQLDFLRLAHKVIEKKPDPRYAKEHYQLIKRNKNIKSLNQSE